MVTRIGIEDVFAWFDPPRRASVDRRTSTSLRSSRAPGAKPSTRVAFGSLYDFGEFTPTRTPATTSFTTTAASRGESPPCPFTSEFAAWVMERNFDAFGEWRAASGMERHMDPGALKYAPIGPHAAGVADALSDGRSVRLSACHIA